MDRSFEVYEGRAMSLSFQGRTRRRVDWMCAQAKGRVLDVGCSQGIVCCLLATKGFTVTGCDKDIDALTFARHKIDTLPSRIRERISLREGDFNAFTSQYLFDTIICGEYLEHLNDACLATSLEHMRELLAPGGIVVITTPAGPHPHPDHQQTFYPRNLAIALERHFSIRYMDIEDLYFRCLCDDTEPTQHLSAQELLYLTEKGFAQAKAAH